MYKNVKTFFIVSRAGPFGLYASDFYNAQHSKFNRLSEKLVITHSDRFPRRTSGNIRYFFALPLPVLRFVKFVIRSGLNNRRNLNLKNAKFNFMKAKSLLNRGNLCCM